VNKESPPTNEKGSGECPTPEPSSKPSQVGHAAAINASTASSSPQVSWWSVNEFVSAVLDQVNDWPAAGTPAWCSLTRDDPRKWAAVLDGGRHHALRMETAQEARAEASRDVSGAADWPKIAREIQQINDFRASRPWARRAAS